MQCNRRRLGTTLATTQIHWYSGSILRQHHCNHRSSLSSCTAPRESAPFPASLFQSSLSCLFHSFQSLPLIPIDATAQWPTFLQQHVNFLANSPLLGQVPALDLCQIPQFPKWIVRGEQAGSVLPGVASNFGTMIGDMTGMDVAMVGNANALPIADEIAHSPPSLADERNVVQF